MWSKKFNKCSLRASTLAELLVVMVVSSIILLLLTDGLNLFGRYSQIITNRVLRNAEIWNSYCRLESLVTSADSLLLTPAGKVEVYNRGEAGTLSLSDSILLFSRNDTRDTLFQTVTGMGISPARYGNDSLSITLSVNDERLRIAFAPRQKPNIDTRELRELEEKYRYE